MKLMIVIALAFCMFSLADCDLATESDAYAVEVIIYRLTTDTWTANGMETTLAGAVSSAANTYCESNTATCGLTTCCTSVSISFKETDVGKVSGYPQKDLKNLKHKFYLKFPTGFTASNSSVTEFVVVNSAVYEILRLARTTFHTSTGYWITWADETYYGVPATTQENQIIIPIAFVVLFAVIFLAIGLHFWNKKKQNEIRLRKKIDDKKAMKKAMVQPTYRVDPDIKDIDDEQAEKTKKDATKKPRKEKMYNDNYPVKQSEETGKKHFGGASDTDSAIKMDPQHEQMDYVESQAQNRNLPPLDVQEEGDKKKKKKKKDKKKKHHGDGYDNQSATLSTEL